MPPGNEQPNISPENIPQNPEAPVSGPEKTPEIAPTPVSTEVPKAEVFNDAAFSPAPVAPPIPAQASPAPVQPITDDREETDEIDKKWVETADAIIEKDKGKPYEEEEDAEKLQVSYLWKRFKKVIGKEKDQN